MTSLPEALGWCLSAGAVVTAATTPLMVRIRRERNALQQQAGTLRARVNALEEHGRVVEAEFTHLAEVRLPAMVKSLRHPRFPVPGLLHEEPADTAVETIGQTIMDQLADAVIQERRRIGAAAQAAMRGSTAELQKMCYHLQTAVEEMQHRYDSADISKDLWALDQLNEQILRRVQVTRVVCGAGPGLTRADSALAELAVGAQSRVRGYERIHIHNHLEMPVAVVARAAEPLAITVTELLANAVHHSHGSLPVDVGLHMAHNGAVITIDDAGTGMTADEMAWARRMLAGSSGVELFDLGDPPRSGFASVGLLSEQFGFRVSLDISRYGGVKATVFVPVALLTTVPEEQPLSAATPQPVTASVAVAPPVSEPAPRPDDAMLPRRRRRQPRPAERSATPTPSRAGRAPSNGTSTQPRSPQENADRMSAMQRGAAAARADGSDRADTAKGDDPA
jgi:hypothetical protein